MADSEIELDAETDDDEPKKKKQKVLQKYLPGYVVYVEQIANLRLILSLHYMVYSTSHLALLTRLL